MESWRKVWRDGVAPGISTESLWKLEEALREDDPRLIQGATTMPPPLYCCEDSKPEGGCALAFVGMCEGLETVGDVSEFFARMCNDADTRIGGAGNVGAFLTWFDDTPRDVMRRELLAEVERSLAYRPHSLPGKESVP